MFSEKDIVSVWLLRKCAGNLSGCDDTFQVNQIFERTHVLAGRPGLSVKWVSMPFFHVQL